MIAVIGGTGINRWSGFELERTETRDTPYGAPSAPLLRGRFAGVPVIFLARHGEGHRLPPHRINYRANLRALKDAGVSDVVALAAVGGINRALPPGGVAAPHDLIDYTWGREHTYSDGADASLQHVEMAEPYSARVRAVLLDAARAAGIEILDRGVMGVTQGPRLESPAEIRRMQRDGCDMVGMTGMPEAALARELGLRYAALAICVNWAAGLAEGSIHGAIERSIADATAKADAILRRALPLLHDPK